MRAETDKLTAVYAERRLNGGRTFSQERNNNKAGVTRPCWFLREKTALFDLVNGRGATYLAAHDQARDAITHVIAGHEGESLRSKVTGRR